MRARTHQERVAHFWDLVIPEPNTGCWLWMASSNEHGYGRLLWGTNLVGAHRLAYELTRGPIPAGLFVCHRCDNPPCCNPAHLFLGTAKDNGADMAAKGRSARGERSGIAKITDAQARELRRLVACGEPVGSVAARFGLRRATAYLIARGETWRHTIRPSEPANVMRTCRKTPEQVAEIRARRAAGETLRPIAKDFGINASSVCRIVRGVSHGDCGGPVQREPRPRKERGPRRPLERIAALAAEGRSAKWIAANLHLDPGGVASTLRSIARRHGKAA